MFLSRINLKNTLKNCIKLMAISSIFLFFGGVTLSSDLLYNTIKNSQNEMIYPGSDERRVGNEVFHGKKEVSGGDTTTIPNIFSKVTRLLLMLVIALSVTMILYNGIKYIVETGQGKDSKSLMKNVAYIIVGILVSLFSIIIITLLRSVPTTIDEDLDKSSNNQTDREQIETKKSFSRGDLFNSYDE